MIRSASIAILSLAVLMSGVIASSSGKNSVEGSQPSFGEIITGFTSKYHQQPAGSFKQDLSGAAVGGGRIVYVDDGGKPSAFNSARVLDAFGSLPDNSDEGAVDLAFTLNHKDLEGATFVGDQFIATTSLGSSTDEAQRRLTRFKVNAAGDQLIDQSSVDLRDELMAELEVFGDANCGGEEWFDRVETTAAKSGGLNIEGISRTDDDESDAILWGIRSPLCNQNFGDPSISPELKLDKGHAIVARVEDPFGANPTFDLQTIRLKTGTVEDGIRGIEWIPALSAYVIIGGTIPAANDYTLWYWEPNEDPEPLELEGFAQLCRPESVIQLTEEGKDYLVVLSEESGAPCVGAPFTYIKAEILVH